MSIPLTFLGAFAYTLRTRVDFTLYPFRRAAATIRKSVGSRVHQMALNWNYPNRQTPHTRTLPANILYFLLWILFTYSISILLAHASVFADGVRVRGLVFYFSFPGVSKIRKLRGYFWCKNWLFLWANVRVFEEKYMVFKSRHVLEILACWLLLEGLLLIFFTKDVLDR